MMPKKAIPTKRNHLTADARRAEALQRLRERFEREHDGEEFDPSREPVITPLLKAADGGIPKVLEALRAHDDDDARDFLELYDSLSKVDRIYLSLEDISYAAGIGSLRLGEIAQTAIFLHGQLTTKLLLSSSMHKVVQTSLAQAQKPKGLVDREWMLKAGGILPVPKGAQIAIQTNVTTEKSETKQLASDDAEPVYLDAGQRLRAIHEAVEGQRRLPAPKSDPLELGSRIGRIQEQAAEVLREDDDVL